MRSRVRAAPAVAIAMVSAAMIQAAETAGSAAPSAPRATVTDLFSDTGIRDVAVAPSDR